MSNNSQKIIFTVFLPLHYPEGIAPGCGSTYNRLLLARDGQGHPVLRGTALAGALRHAFDTQNGVANTFFGSAEDQKLTPSRLKIQDSQILLPAQSDTKGWFDFRTHHLRNRHTGVVLDGALFSLESCPPGTKTETVLWLESNDNTKDEDKEFLAQIVRLFSPKLGGFYLGGSTARGIGRAILDPKNPPLLREFQLDQPDDWADWFSFRSGARDFTKWEDFSQEKDEDQEKVKKETRLKVEFTLTIPPGQDILIADGDMAPQRVTGADGKTYWRIPGSTMRGLFRSFILRLAARAGKTIADTVDIWQETSSNGKYTGDSLAWAFMDKLLEKDQLRKTLKGYPVESLFGTVFQRGRIHFSDALSPCEEQWDSLENRYCEEEQRRMHVKIDPISGGAVPLALFSNTVLTSAKSPRFTFTMTVDQPTEEEVIWLVRTLQALDFGLLRLGTSKASGRVKLVDSPKASCPAKTEWETYFTKINPSSAPDVPAPARPTLSWQPSIFYIEGNTLEAKHPDPERDSRITIDSENVIWYGREKLKNGDEISVVFACDRITHICPRGQEPAEDEEGGTPAPLKPWEFHNPYTAIPFPNSPINRTEPTLQTQDEVNDSTLKSGWIDVEVTTERPLISLHPIELTGRRNDERKPGVYNALTIGEDVIVPATSIRGQLRSLSTIFTGSSLSSLDMDRWIYEHLRGASVVDERKLFLAEVVTPGNSEKPGKIRLFSEVRLISRNALVEGIHSQNRNADFRNLPSNIEKKRFILENVQDFPAIIDPQNMTPVNRIVLNRTIQECENNNPEGWRVRPSGQPIGVQYVPTQDLRRNINNNQHVKVKKEALVRGEGLELTLPPRYWRQFEDVHPGNSHPLKKGTIIWLEPVDDSVTEITDRSQIKSIQWTRWAKKTRKLCDAVDHEYWPDYMQSNPGLVDQVTNLFGQVNSTNCEDVPVFAGRVRAENLVFSGAKSSLIDMPLAPLCQPHMGCFQFYMRENEETNNWMFRGYKVYRVSEDGDEPWKYGVQFVANNQGQVEDFMNQNQGKRVQMLPAGQTGHVRIAFRGLTNAELALLYTVCTSKWRLGCGKPFGLGLCATRATVQLWNDDGSLSEPEDDSLKPTTLIANQASLWKATQRPVARVRYPRAGKKTIRNHQGHETINLQVGGHSWFSIFSGAQGDYTLKSIHVAANSDLYRLVNARCIDGQKLPEFNSEDLNEDVLKYLDIVPIVQNQNNGANQISRFTTYSEIGLPEDPGLCDNINNSLNARMRQENQMARLPEKIRNSLRDLGIQWPNNN